MGQFRTPLALLLGLGALFACGGNAPAPQPAKPAESASAQKPSATEKPTGPSGEATGEELAYSYTPVGKRDPFRSFFPLASEGASLKQTELQKFELDQLKLVAIVVGRAAPYAMVEDPNGKGHTLTRGTSIGKNLGRISAITDDCVIIKEEYRDYTGRKVVNQISMCLPKPGGLNLD